MMSDKDLSKKTANEQLMSCPFCGGKAQVSEHVVPVTRFLDFGRIKMTSESKYGITCQKCGAMSSQCYETMGEAVAAWNTRVSAPQEMTAREFVREMLRLRYKYRTNSTLDDALAFLNWEDAMAVGDVDEAVSIIEQWAREHPEERKE